MEVLRQRRPAYTDFCYLCTTRGFLDDAMLFAEECDLPYISLVSPPEKETADRKQSQHMHHAVGLIVSAYCFVTFPAMVTAHPLPKHLTEKVMMRAETLTAILRDLFAPSSLFEEEEEDGRRGKRRPPPHASAIGDQELIIALHRFQGGCYDWQRAQMPFTVCHLKESLLPGRAFDPTDNLPFPLCASHLFPNNPIVVSLNASSFPSAKMHVDEALFRTIRSERIEELLQMLRCSSREERAVLREANAVRSAHAIRAHVQQLRAARTQILSEWIEPYTDNSARYIEAELEYAYMKLRKLLGEGYKDFIADEFEAFEKRRRRSGADDDDDDEAVRRRKKTTKGSSSLDDVLSPLLGARS